MARLVRNRQHAEAFFVSFWFGVLVFLLWHFFSLKYDSQTDSKRIKAHSTQSCFSISLSLHRWVSIFVVFFLCCCWCCYWLGVENCKDDKKDVSLKYDELQTMTNRNKCRTSNRTDNDWQCVYRAYGIARDMGVCVCARAPPVSVFGQNDMIEWCARMTMCHTE